MYVLIAFYVSVSVASAPFLTQRGIAMQEFSSRAKCVAAAEIIRNETKQGALCLRK
ncbi:MAG: hypothetical protein ABI433_03610 [Burkholderiaceae bacterium]